MSDKDKSQSSDDATNDEEINNRQIIDNAVAKKESFSESIKYQQSISRAVALENSLREAMSHQKYVPEVIAFEQAYKDTMAYRHQEIAAELIAHQSAYIEANELVLAPMKAMLDKVYAPAVAMQEFNSKIANMTTSISNFGKAISDGLVRYNNYATKIANSIGNFASAIAQMQKAFANAPIWEELSNINQLYSEWMNTRLMLKKAVIERWENLDYELKNKNRFFPEVDFLQIFDECTKEASMPLRKGRILHRARIIKNSELPESSKGVVAHILENTNDNLSDSPAYTMSNLWKHAEGLSEDKWDELINELGLNQNIYWGFDEKNSGAPKSSASHGRINPSGISYLYTSLGVKTAIAEVQPMNEALVSVAKIKTKKALQIFSFDFYEAFTTSKLMEQPLGEFESLTGKTFWELQVFFDTMSELFSRPSFGNDANYYATQYLSEYIKSKGFDGIKFKSSLHKGGYNVVLFDTEKDEEGTPINYEVISTNLHVVKSVRVISKQMLPRQVKKATS